MLDALEEFFKYAEFNDDKSFVSFSKWIADLSIQKASIEVAQKRIVSILTNIAHHNPKMLRQVFRASISLKPGAGANFILAIGNVLIDDDFETKYKDGRAVVLASIISHIDNPSQCCRQAELKIVCLSGQKHFYEGDSNEAKMPITSESASGYIVQAKKFIKFIAEAAKTEDCVGSILLLSEDFEYLEDQERVLPNIALLVQRIANDSKTLANLLNITSKVDPTNP